MTLQMEFARGSCQGAMKLANRDPIKTARNARIAIMKERLRELLPQVLNDTGFDNEASLNAKIGGKAAHFINLLDEVIISPEQYRSLFLQGFKKSLSVGPYENAYDRLYKALKASPAAQQYFMLFVERSYLKHYDELAKKRPKVEEAEVWIGQNRADYGLLVTPRFVKGQWENDKSEIRHFQPLYWTIGHVLRTGLVVPGKKQTMPFKDPEAYLNFFRNVLVRNSGSSNEYAIAEMYSKFVLKADDPLRVPLLIPEFRYDGLTPQHRYRLDFTVIDPYTMDKVGFELSPWATHGYLRKTGHLSQAQINKIASDNFDKEMRKHKDYFRKHAVYALIFTETDLKDIKSVFAEIRRFLTPENDSKHLDFHLMEKFFETTDAELKGHKKRSFRTF
jgi:hypothetical protein